MRRAITTDYQIPDRVIVDPEDLPLLANYNRWFIRKRGTVEAVHQKTLNGRKTYTSYKLHRVIMGVTDSSVEVDHINHNPLDNRKINLRICSHAENSRNLSVKKNNTSGFSGVRWDKSRSKWIARLKICYRDVHIGRYSSFEEAVSARLFAEDHYFGEFAPNLIKEMA